MSPRFVSIFSSLPSPRFSGIIRLGGIKFLILGLQQDAGKILKGLGFQSFKGFNVSKTLSPQTFC